MKNLSSKKRNRVGFIAIAIILILMVGALAGCNRGNDNGTETPGTTPQAGNQQTPSPTPDPPTPATIYVPEEFIDAMTLDPNTVGEITIMTWGQTLGFYADIGRRVMDAEELREGWVVAQLHASARAFNELFPYIQINHNAQQFINTDDMPFHQNRENFTMTTGLPVDIFWTNDLPGEISRGQVADLSVFRDDPRFQSINPTIIDMMTYEGRPFGLPWQIAPEGIWVNRALAEMNNVDVPPPNWTWDQYLDFISHYSEGEWYGAWHVGLNTLFTSLNRDFQVMLRERGPNDPFVNVNSQAMRNLLGTAPRIAAHAGEGFHQQGLIPQEFMDAAGWSFGNGMLFVGHGNAWLYGGAWTILGGTAFNQHPGDFDIFPIPSTPYMPNHARLEMDIIAMRNFAMDDGNPELSEAEYQQMRIAWEFLAFHLTDPRALQARINQTVYDAELNPRPALGYSLPIVTGAAFDEQMALLFTTEGFRTLADRNMYPGFHMLVDLFRDGQIMGTQFRDIPGTHEFEGDLRSIVWEWNNMQNGNALDGIRLTDPGWLDTVLAHLPEFNDTFNQRWADRYAQLSADIARFYPNPTTRP